MIDEKKQIDEMANDIAAMCPDLVNSGCGDLSCVACLSKGMEQMGYRKQIEGEWRDGICTNCGHEALEYLEETPCGCSMRTYITKHCPNCGAWMKGDK